MKILISSKQKYVLKRHAQDEFPLESCALLFGKKDNDLVFVHDVFLTNNIEKSSINFTISNVDLIQGYSKAEKLGVDVVGIFHSHPNSEAIPSQTDRKFMEINPVVWVIYSSPKQEFRAFILENKLVELSISES